MILFVITAAGVSGAVPLVNGMVADLFDDRARGRAVGALYGIVSLFVAVFGLLIGQLSRNENGWRYGFFVAGGMQLLFGLLAALFFRDPGVGAAEAAQPRQQPRTPLPIRDDLPSGGVPDDRSLTRERTWSQHGNEHGHAGRDFGILAVVRSLVRGCAPGRIRTRDRRIRSPRKVLSTHYSNCRSMPLSPSMCSCRRPAMPLSAAYR